MCLWWLMEEIIISEAHSLLAHLGASKTLSYLRDYIWWKDIVSDTKAYCETCNTCKWSKPSSKCCNIHGIGEYFKLHHS